jgi:cytochrome b561
MVPVKVTCDPMAEPHRYTGVAISLHWAVALLIFAAFPIGLFMHDMPLTPDKLRLFSYHKWIGVTVVALTVVRLAWRVANRPPALPASMVGWQLRSASVMHALLYLLVLVVPVTGWLMSSAEGFQTVWFGVLPLPDLLPRDKHAAALLLEVHKDLNFLMLTLIAGHAAVALIHRFVHRDGVLERMLP